MNVVNIKYLTDSDECLLIKNLSKLDSSASDFGDMDFFRENIQNKLFRQFDEKNINSIFLKNKYLYFLDISAMAYLEAVYSMNGDIIKSDVIEENEVVTILKAIIPNYKEYDYVSLGCGDGEKDYGIIRKLQYYPKYIPIDISPTLLQLTSNYFKVQQKYKGDFIGINCDFFNLPNLIVPEFNNERKKILYCLGGTVGNYDEVALLDRFYSIMNKDDYLVLSFELLNDRDNNDNIRKYNTHSNIEFITKPLKLVPQYRGYLENHTKYLKFQNVFDYNPIISKIEDSKSFYPTFSIPHQSLEVYLAWSTKYQYDSLIKHFESHKKFNLLKASSKNGRCIILLQADTDINKLEQLKNNVIAVLNKYRITEAGETNNINKMIKYVKSTTNISFLTLISENKFAYPVIKSKFDEIFK